LSEHGEDDPQKRLTPINESLIIDTIRIEAERRQQAQDEKDEQDRKRQVAHDRQMLRVQLGLFIATLLTGIVALYQAHVSSVSAEAAKSAAETASQTMAAMKTSATESTTQVTAVIDHLNSLAGSMKASVGQGRDVLKASIDASRHEYRPWITFTAALTFLPLDLAYDTPFYNSEVVTTLQPNRGIVGRIALNNIGRSPARNVVVHLRLVYVETHSPTQILEFGERAFQDAFRKDLIVRTHITLAPPTSQPLRVALVRLFLPERLIMRTPTMGRIRPRSAQHGRGYKWRRPIRHEIGARH
jgi:hypothetical protein